MAAGKRAVMEMAAWMMLAMEMPMRTEIRMEMATVGLWGMAQRQNSAVATWIKRTLLTMAMGVVMPVIRVTAQAAETICGDLREQRASHPA